MLFKNASTVQLPIAEATSSDKAEEVASPKSRSGRRLSFRPFTPKQKPALRETQEHEKKHNATAALTKRLSKPLSNSADKRAKESALILRSLIVGPTHDYVLPKPSTPVVRPQLHKVKAELMEPGSANKVIAHLRALPPQDDNDHPSGPIHAVCLAYPDADEHKLHFAQFTQDKATEIVVPHVAAAPLEMVVDTFNSMHVVDLVAAPDLGLGQPGDGKGLLAGAVPTAETVIKGIQQITPQLMALGYATGKAVLPDHKGVHPPTDRMSVLTYWWGLELVLPPPTMAYLSDASSINGTLVNFLTALSLVNGGVKELLPFVRYLSQFVDFEWSVISKADEGQGVVCASTWIMPAALVPRPWDFPPPDPTTPDSTTAENGAEADKLPSAPAPISPDANNPNPPASKAPFSPPTSVPSRLLPPVVHHTSQPALRPGLSMT
ncbi:Lactamase-B domain-containing protein [Mycena chlorophos]|uniref:Lactamase-B domain-containing protein n=1 Tax=Mycena chlorophos TaxID=658473 RepID=A0A8H6RYC4_MYCCL|nr:Lactamase-B domain-containing protein [Mycena chlorophos]